MKEIPLLKSGKKIILRVLNGELLDLIDINYDIFR